MSSLIAGLKIVKFKRAELLKAQGTILICSFIPLLALQRVVAEGDLNVKKHREHLKHPKEGSVILPPDLGSFKSRCLEVGGGINPETGLLPQFKVAALYHAIHSLSYVAVGGRIPSSFSMFVQLDRGWRVRTVDGGVDSCGRMPHS